MEQYGFLFDQSRCSGCRTCAVACKTWNGLPPGPLKYLKIYEYESGIFPDILLNFHWIPCFHCESPSCIDVCPRGAIFKEDKFGAVLIDNDKCIGCRECYQICPYGAPVFESDKSGVKAHKCDMCIDRLNVGLKPICVLSCPNRALDFGPLKSLVNIYGNVRDLKDLPDSQITHPAIVFKPHYEKKLLVTYNSEKARKLMGISSPIAKAATYQAEKELIGRSRLILKHNNVASLMYSTRNDEG